ncbi:hypothetical protein Bca101_051041 [Brassica carinata]
MRDHPQIQLCTVGLKRLNHFESFTLSELSTHGLTASPEVNPKSFSSCVEPVVDHILKHKKEAEFLCTAVFESIDTADGRCYISCFKC